jgi:hypothetical protein
MAMLVILTLMVLSAASMSTNNVKATANMQFRDAAFAAANLAVEQVVSTAFTNAPQAVAVDLDLNRDGTNDYTVQVPAPSCTRWGTIPNSQLDPGRPEDVPCYGGARGGGLSAGGSQSFCAESTWAVRAPVTDNATGAAVTVNQGIGVRMSVDQARNACN